jgi:hypothetical protein
LADKPSNDRELHVDPARAGRWSVRIVDSTDLDDPVGAAEGRAVFELYPTPAPGPSSAAADATPG